MSEILENNICSLLSCQVSLSSHLKRKFYGVIFNFLSSPDKFLCLGKKMTCHNRMEKEWKDLTRIIHFSELQKYILRKLKRRGVEKLIMTGEDSA